MKLQKLISHILIILLSSALQISPAKAESFSRPLSASGDFAWAQSIGGTSNDRGYGIVIDSFGNIITTGHFAKTVDFDPGNGIFELVSANLSEDIFISKMNNNGGFVWAKQIGRTGSDTGYSVAVDPSGNVYVTGYFSGYNGGNSVDFDPGVGTFSLSNTGGKDIFILKLDSSGNFVWARGMGSTGDESGNDIAIDSNGNVYTTGYFSNTVDFDPGNGVSTLTSAGMGDIFVSKLDSAGSFVWAKRMGGTGMGGAGLDQGYGIAVDTNGNVYTTGSFEPAADFDPGAGVFDLENAGGTDAFISKLDSNGNFVWAKSIGGTDIDVGYDITLDSNNNIYTTGYFWGVADFDPSHFFRTLISAGGKDIFVSKLDSNGECIWGIHIGGGSDDYGKSITADSIGNVFITGDFLSDTVSFFHDPGSSNLSNEGIAGSDTFIFKVTNNGNLGWAKNMGSTGNAGGEDITLDNNGNVFTTGYFSGIVDFDAGVGTYNLTSMGVIDIFISKLENNGNELVVKNINDSGIDSLRQVIQDATNGDMITFDPSLAGETIHLTSELLIDKTITINGSNLSPSIKISGDTENDGNGNVQLMTITSFADVTIDNIDLINGFSTTSLKSGGINNFGLLTVYASTFSGNIGNQGGAIRNSGELFVTGSTFSQNSAPDGGAILNDIGAYAVITSSTFTQNTAGGQYGSGGAIGNIGNLIVSSSEFSQNTAVVGGGAITNSISGQASITNSTISGNSSTNGGGGVASADTTITVLRNTTLSNNTNGGLYILGGNVYLINSILANSTGLPDCYKSGGNISTNLNMIIENNATGVNSCGTPLIASDPNLGQLANNGGFTRTMALLPSSPAIDAGDDATCASAPVNNTSQNGITRPRGSHCDIGAYEYPAPFPDLIITNVTINPTVPLPNQTFEVSITIKNQGGTGSANTVFRDVYINRDPSTLIDPTTGCPPPGDFFRSDSYTSIPAGMTDTKTVTITGGLPSGNHQFWFYVDSRCLVDEGGGSNSVP